MGSLAHLDRAAPTSGYQRTSPGPVAQFLINHCDMRGVMACAKFRAAGEVAVAEFRSSSGKPMHHASRNSLSLAS